MNQFLNMVDGGRIATKHMSDHSRPIVKKYDLKVKLPSFQNHFGHSYC